MHNFTRCANDVDNSVDIDRRKCVRMGAWTCVRMGAWTCVRMHVRIRVRMRMRISAQEVYG